MGEENKDKECRVLLEFIWTLETGAESCHSPKIFFPSSTRVGLLESRHNSPGFHFIPHKRAPVEENHPPPHDAQPSQPCTRRASNVVKLKSSTIFWLVLLLLCSCPEA